VVVVHVSDVFRWQLFDKIVNHFQLNRTLDDGRLLVQMKFGLDLTSIQRAVLCAPSSGKEADYLILQGPFEVEKVKAALKKQNAMVHKVDGAGPEGTYYQVIDASDGTTDYYVALLGPRTLAFTRRNESALISVLEKLASPRKEDFKDKELLRVLDRLDPRMAAQILMGGNLIIDKDKGIALQDEIGGPGIKSVSGGVFLAGGAELRFMVSCINEKKAKEVKDFVKGLLFLISLQKEAAPLAQALGAADFTIGREDKSMLFIERRFSPKDIMGLLPKAPR
jgi:hypothetical protein